ncbi:hypothetical protein EJB05_26418, partial [Eragrostis curvula]
MTFISLANTISMAGCFFLYASTAVAALGVRVREAAGDQGPDLGGHGGALCQDEFDDLHKDDGVIRDAQRRYDLATEVDKTQCIHDV